MNMFEYVVEIACLAVNGSTRINYIDTEIDFKRPWKRVKMIDAIKEKNGIDVLNMTKDEILEFMKKNGIDFDPAISGNKGVLIAA
jgi:lysyl-tRNA synthetase class 2